MLTRIRIADFQSIAKLDIDVDAAVVLLTGPSDNGKSAILRAINTAVSRGIGGSYFRVKPNGKTSTSLSVAISARRKDGAVAEVIWEKTKKNARYIVNDRVFDNCGKTVPDAVPQELGLSSVSDLGEFLHYRGQHEKHFLLADRGPKDAYRFLSTILGADVVIRVLNDVESRRRKIADETVFAEAKAVEEEAAVAAYFAPETVAEGQRLCAGAGAVVDAYEALERRRVALLALKEAMAATAAKDTQLQNAGDILKALVITGEKAAVVIQSGKTLSERIAAASEISQGLSKIAVSYTQTQALAAVTGLDIGQLKGVMDTVLFDRGRLAAATATSEAMSSLSEKRLPVGVDVLEGLATAATAAVEGIANKKTAAVALGKISETYMALADLWVEKKKLQESVTVAETEKAEIQKQLGCGGDVDRCPFLSGGRR